MRCTPAGAWGRMLLLGVLAPLAGPVAAGEPGSVQYGRDIRPILSDACFSCHGPDAGSRKGDLRLDNKEDTLRERDGYAVVVPGDPEASELLGRITADDPTIVMPPPESGKTITPEQRERIGRWIAEGAAWQEHWAFLAPERPAVPAVAETDRVRTPVDAFLLQRLAAEGLEPEAEADRATLIRRVSLDLTGLPPTPQEVDAFLADTAPDAYENLIDRLLQSPRYGEHMARFWLDAARYGDTHGLHLDNYREMWPYRDWVVSAFNGNLPFDQFAVEQLAGDMLPDATLDQRIASGFNRAHVTTSEGGSIDEEVYVRNVVDRVDTTGTVFLGLTVGCARCHDHKFDPLTMKEYYSLFGVFNSLDESPLDGNAARHAPFVQVPTPEATQQLAALDQQIAEKRTQLAAELAKAVYDGTADASQGEYVRRDDFVWVEDAVPPGASPSSWAFVGGQDHPIHTGGASVRQAAGGDQMIQQSFEGAEPGLKIGPGDVLFAHVFIDPVDPPRELMLQWNSGEWKHRAYWGENLVGFGADGTSERLRVGELPLAGTWVRLEVPAAAVGLTPGTVVKGFAVTQHGGTAYWDRAGSFTWTPQPGTAYQSLTAWIRDQKATGLTEVPEPLRELVKKPRAERTPEQVKQLRDHFVQHVFAPLRGVFGPLQTELARLEKERTDLNESIPTTLVSKERSEPRPAFLLDRGEYDRRKDPVARATPGFLPPLPAGQTADRLTFARWLVAPEHPLAARVAVNRFWQQVFGTGLVKTAEDFGAQGEPPSHPELLDWLAVEFRESGWDVKGLMKTLLMSQAYRQSARATPEKLEKDPANRLLSRGPRFRLDAESLRDQALYLGGILVEKAGGPSVKPPQPSGLWEAVGYTGSNTARFSADQGPEKVHRRSLYTFWKRTSAPPQLTTFDAPSRESCTVRRERTNTPLQALLLMNEPQYVESARFLATRAMREAGSTPQERITYLFRLATARTPEPQELEEITSAYNDFLATYRGNPDAAQLLIRVGDVPPDGSLDAAELAAWTMVGNLILNLDEVITKG